MPKYQPEKHRAEGGFRVLGLPLLFGPLFLVSVAVGWLASFIGQWFYLIFLFPMGIGLVLVLAASMLGKWTHLRSPLIAGLAGLFAGLVSMTSMHVFDYLRAMSDPQLMAVMAQNPQARMSFLDFMHAQATAGVTIGKGDGLNLGYVGSWIYWLLEVALVAVGCFAVVMVGATEPYCSHCEKWKKYRQLGTFDEAPDVVKLALEEGDVDLLYDYYPYTKGGAAVLSAAVCPTGGDDCDITVKLEHVTFNEKKEEQRSDLVELTYPGEALADLEDVFAKTGDMPEPEKPSNKKKAKSVKKEKRREEEDY